MDRRGIILAGGTGTRLHPITIGTSKQLLPVYDKPMIYYPLTVLMLSGIRDILIITTPEDQAAFKRLLGDGSQWGVALDYVVQPSPDGLAQAFILGEAFLGGLPSAMVLGDNIYYGHGLTGNLTTAAQRARGATVFGYHVTDPQRYGIVEFDRDGRVVSMEEKPARPKSNFAVTGLYFFDEHAPAIAKSLSPSARGELEITDMLQVYLNQGLLNVELLGRGFAWLDTGTFESLAQAGEFVRALEQRQGLKVACPEEIALGQGWIDAAAVERIGRQLAKSAYGQYLLKLVGAN